MPQRAPVALIWRAQIDPACARPSPPPRPCRPAYTRMTMHKSAWDIKMDTGPSSEATGSPSIHPTRAFDPIAWEFRIAVPPALVVHVRSDTPYEQQHMGLDERGSSLVIATEEGQRA